MPHAARLAVVLSLLATACQPGSLAMTDAAPDTERYARNPAPTQAYRITIRIDDAPGPFASVRALAQYDVTNRECLAPPDSNPGGRSSPVPTQDIEIPLTPAGDGRYMATVYADAMQDGDYSGNGPCHWQLMQFRVHMKATGTGRETLFIPAIADEKLLAGLTETVYFNKISYPLLEASELDEPLSFGQTDRSRFGPSLTDEDLFTVTFTASKDAAE